MRRGMALFFSLILVSILTLPNPCSANNIFTAPKQVVAQLFEYLLPHYSHPKKLHDLVKYQPVNQMINVSDNGIELHTLSDIFGRNDELLPIIDNLEVHDNMIWSIVFNDEINPSSITNETLFIFDSEGKRVPTIIINDSMRTINILPPIDKYDVGETYFLYFTNEIESSTGEKMPEGFMLQFSIQDIHFLQVEPTRSLQLNLSFEAGYKGASIHNSSPVHYDHDLLNQVNDDMNNRQLDDEFLMRLMKKFDEIEEQKL